MVSEILTKPPYIEGHSIVVRGTFNPAIFHPSWFVFHKLLREEEVQAAEQAGDSDSEGIIVTSEGAAFVVGDAGWLRVNATRDRLQFGTIRGDYFEELRNVTVGALRALRHTPVRVVGMNREFHYELDSEEEWHAIGDRLAPKTAWKQILGGRPGLVGLVIEGERPGERPGYIRVTVRPSDKVVNGVFVNVNDHYEVESRNEVFKSISEVIQIIKEQWNDSLDRGNLILNGVINIARNMNES